MNRQKDNIERTTPQDEICERYNLTVYQLAMLCNRGLPHRVKQYTRWYNLDEVDAWIQAYILKRPNSDLARKMNAQKAC